MITLQGKYNFAHVFTDNPDETTVGQIIQMLNHPAFKGIQIRIMPDCHAGAGCVVGFTAELGDYIIPNVVGVDIGCGIYSWNLGKIKIDFDYLDSEIRKNIPSGFGIRSDFYSKYNELNQFISDILSETLVELKLDNVKVLKSIGSLGGGNHFIEIGKDENEDIWLTIHSGSRNFGLQIAKYYQNKALNFIKEAIIDGIPKGMEYLPIKYGGKEYLEKMKIAQKFAHYNRVVMGKIIIESILKSEIKENVFSVHNYIDFKDNIIRKGAIRSYEKEDVVIPFNMRDGLIIGTGKSSKKWNFSAPHGAGRIMSRSKAKELIDLDKFKESMKGIYTTSISKSTLDESPFVYKDKDEIINAISETVDIKHFVKPIYNFKAN